ncbi:ATP-binding protein [Nocardiopsis sp. CNT-189]|uniref:hypothetical protein n=1 Tax=Nocardiopsis oceanisediminis TaxID=2816862 RepID=UPI003B355009
MFKKGVLQLALQAVTRVPLRAERQEQEALSETFIDVGPVASSLRRPDHQIMYGRRGTGKTHALLNLKGELEADGVNVVYLDMRTAGSASGLYGSRNEGIAERATPLLVDVIEEIHNSLLDLAIERGNEDLLEALSGLAAASTEIEVVGPVELEHARQENNKGADEVAFKAGTAGGANLSYTVGMSQESASEVRSKASGSFQFSLKFGPIAAALRRVVRRTPGRRLWILVDEWSATPLDLQPLLADLFRRALFPVGGITVKIAAIERRSEFSLKAGGGEGEYVGIELGSDASQDISLDDYLVFTEEDGRAIEFFSNLFHRHCVAMYPELETSFPGSPEGVTNFIWAIWGNWVSFEELVRAAEGIPRDGINIAGLAAQRASPQTRYMENGISVNDVRGAARAWFVRDKEGAIKADKIARRALANLVSFACARRRRTFLVERGYDSHHRVIRSLYDARLVHILRSAVGPGGQYDLFALDYGAYVNALSDHEAVKSWNEPWVQRWAAPDPVTSPEVRKAIFAIDRLLAKPIDPPPSQAD